MSYSAQGASSRPSLQSEIIRLEFAMQHPRILIGNCTALCGGQWHPVFDYLDSEVAGFKRELEEFKHLVTGGAPALFANDVKS